MMIQLRKNKNKRNWHTIAGQPLTEMDKRIMYFQNKGHLVPTRDLIKTPEQIEGIRAAGVINTGVLDEMAKVIVRRDGMIGLNLCPAFIHEDKDKQNIAMLLRHIDHCIEITDEDHIGFGGDVDGIGHYPEPLTKEDSVHDQIIDIMVRHGYSDSLIRKVAYENYMNFLRKYL